MRNITLCFLLLLITGVAEATNIFITYINDEISESLQSEITEIHSQVFNTIETKDYSSFKKFLSPQLIEMEGLNITEIVDYYYDYISKYDYVVADQYYSKFKESDITTSIIASFNEDKLIINNLKVHGNEAYNVFLRSDNDGIGYIVYISLFKYNGEWKVNLMHIGNDSISRLTAPGLYKHSKKLKDNNRLVSSTFYAFAMYKLLRPAPYLQYKNEKMYIEYSQNTVKEINELLDFPINISNMKIFNIDIMFSHSDGITPIISYLTETELEAPVIVDEANESKENIMDVFPGIEQDFKSVVMKAYNEMPSDPKKKYRSYNTILEFDK